MGVRSGAPHDAVADHWREGYTARAEVREPRAAARRRLLQIYENRHATLAAVEHLVGIAVFGRVEPVVVEAVPVLQS